MATGKPCINLRRNKHGHILLQGAANFFKNKLKIRSVLYTPDGSTVPQAVRITDKKVRVLNPPSDKSAATISIHGLDARSRRAAKPFRGHYSVFTGTLLITLINDDDTGPPIDIVLPGDFYVDDPNAPA